jgi:hypothetical protein
MWRRGYAGLLSFASQCSFTDHPGRQVQERKVVENIFIFNFGVHEFSLKHLAEEM